MDIICYVCFIYVRKILIPYVYFMMFFPILFMTKYLVYILEIITV